MTDERDDEGVRDADDGGEGAATERTRPGGRRAKKKRKTPWLWKFVVYAFLLFAAFGLGALLFNSVIMPAFVGHSDEVKVPNVTGKELNAAEALVARAGLRLGETRRRHDPRPAGTVIAQHPDAGTEVKSRRSVILVVSLGEQGATVPDLTGESMRNVELALRQVDLEVGDVFKVPSRRVDADAVIATEPPAGAAAAKGSAVNVLMSSGASSPGYLMPDLRGLDAVEVERRLRDVGFDVSVTSRGGLFGGRRRISDHVPEPGARVWPGRTVTLYTD